jgi:hypothetical protein
MEEKILENKVCKKCNSSFEITDKDLEFYKKISPTFNWKKYLIPPPMLCPDCRQQRRLSFKNDRKIYKRTCDASWKQIISIYSPEKKYKIYEQKIWWSDSWSPLNYSKEIDFKKLVFEQFNQLMKEVPVPSLANINCENCDYSHALVDSKNSYLCFWNTDIEDVFYSFESWKSKSSCDMLWSYNIENSYEISNCEGLVSCYFCTSSNSLYKCYFCSDCNNCKNCLFCFWLNNKEYHIFNIEYSKEEYEKKLNDFLKKPSFIEDWKNISNDFFLKMPHKHINSHAKNNSIWDYIYSVKDVYYWFIVVGLENCRYVYECWRSKDTMDSNYVYECEWKIYECLEANNSFNVFFSISVTNSKNIFLSNNITNCNNCFLCVWLRNKEYCILNKEYSKEEYEKITAKIIEKMIETWEWWEFFSSYISYFWYNETVAEDYFTLNKNEALKKWFNWSDYENPSPQADKIIKAFMMPYDIFQIPNDILNRGIECEITKKPFRIIASELEFYRKHNLPIPKRHPDQRHIDRLKQRNPRKLFSRICDKCHKEIKSSYSSERKEIIYCEGCYNEYFIN